MAKPHMEKSALSALFNPVVELLPPIPLDVSHLTARDGGVAGGDGAPGVDLAGKQKLILLCGPGATGKTTFARWLGEQSILRDDGNPVVMLSMDDSRSLCGYFAPGGVAAPPAGVSSRTWFEQALTALERSGRSAIADFGGGDRVLLDLAREVPGLHLALAARGITPVVLYFLSSRAEDLSLAAGLEGLGFQPEAVSLVLNCSRVANPARDFEQIRHQPEYQSLLNRGAIEVWLPKHYAAAAVEHRKQGFVAVNSALNGFDQYRNERWLKVMQAATARISSWLI